MELIYLWTENYKNLKHGYQLSPKYEVSSTEAGFEVVKVNSCPSTFFSKEANIQISAIVGSNGSGKSNILKKILDILYRSENKDSRIRDFLIAEVDGKLIYVGTPKKSITYNNNPISNYKKSFYTIYFNYMLDSLKDSNNERWFNNIFHRSDSYKTPILIEPFKKNDIIDMSSIEYLNKQRIILHGEYNNNNKLNELFSPKYAKITLNISKIQSILEMKKKGNCLRSVLNAYKSQVKDTINLISYKDTFDKEQMENSKRILDKTKNRVISKYTSNLVFSRKLNQASENKNLNSKIRIDAAIKNSIIRTELKILNLIYTANKIDRINSKTNENIIFYLNKAAFTIDAKIKDASHRTIKLRNAIKYQSYLNLKCQKDKLMNLHRCEVNDEFLKNIPSWLDVDFYNENDVNYSSLSSGEKSLYTLLTTIKYHLNNILSYENNEKEMYSNFVLLLDEVDLGLHPKWQRDFIYDIIEFIKAENMPSINIQLIITSHSPFIISDIPRNRVLFLENGFKSSLNKHIYTFGENIHSLLSDSFFMSENLLTGKFAQGKIEDGFSLISRLHEAKKNSKNIKNTKVYSEYNNNRDSLIHLSNIIGDQYLKVAFGNALSDAERIVNNSNEVRELDIELLKEKLMRNPDLLQKWMNEDE
ncbi:TPA: AAA family ATPase [Vibrio parahaemolyticus]|nr:AAA family ATPase [Vibrio parahaemolyticus]